MTSRNARLIVLFILLGIFSFHFINNAILIYHHNHPLASKVSILCFVDSVVRYHSFTDSRNFSSFYRLYTEILQWPLLLYGATLAYPLLGISLASARIMNMLYFFILLYSTYGIGRIMFNRKIGLFAAFLVSCTPGIFNFSRIFCPDFLLAAMVALTLYLYLKTDNFRSLKYSVLFGISIGLGFLTKQSYPLFLGAPFVYFFVCEYFTDGMRLLRKKALFHLALALGVGLLLAASFYAPNFRANLETMKTLSFDMQLSAGKTLLQLLRDRILLKPLFIISTIAFFTYLRRKELFLPLIVIVPIFLFSLSGNIGGGRYLLPILSATSIIVSAEIFSFPSGNVIIVPLVTLFVIAQFFLRSYQSLPFMKQDIMQSRQQTVESQGKIDYVCNQLMNILIANKSEPSGDAQVIFACFGDKERDLAYVLSYNLAVKKFKFSVWMYIPYDLFALKRNFKTFPAALDEVLRKTDFVIWKNGSDHDVGIGRLVWKTYTYDFDIIRELRKAFETHKDNFKVCGKFTWPDKSEILVYKNKMKEQ